ncbi:MAG: Plasmid stabilization system protein [Rhodobacteraceae bacterium HLUCCO18]|nr:MAG: Plasmid stabilization system protein [Rhodobacteraceae bacterium HLUCCO18]
MKRLDVSPNAEADLGGIWTYTFQTWGEVQANKYLDDLDTRMIGLTTGRTASPAADEVAPGLRRALVGRHVVFFREDAAAVTVVRVLHQRMDVGRG